MSLVNKMLRDLDARRAGEAERSALPPAVTPLAARQAKAPLWPKLALAGVVVAAGLAAAWMRWSNVSPAAPAASVSAAGAALPPAPLARLPVVANAVSPAPTPVPSPLALKESKAGLQLPHGLKSTVAKAEPAPAKLAEMPAVAAPRAVNVVAKTVRGPSPAGDTLSRIDKQERVASPAERAEADYRQGREAQRAGRFDDALAHYQAALNLFPEQAAARQSLAALLIEARQWDAAEQVLREGVELPAVRLPSTLALARLLVERSQGAAALDLMEKRAASGERSAEYQGFLAVLLGRAGRSHDAVDHYQAATRLAPDEARWWAGLGIALEADGQSGAAREAYLKARSLPGLPPELAQHIEQRLR